MISFKNKFMLFGLAAQMNTLSAQYIPPFVGQIDSSRYTYYVSGIRVNGILQPSDSAFGKHNVFICYLHLKAPEDTVIKYLNQAIQYDNIFECEQLWAKVNHYASLFKSYRKPWISYCKYCDSVKTTFDVNLMQTLQQMDKDDQKYRKDMGMQDIKIYPAIWRQQVLLDSLNVIKLDSIVKLYGYPTKKRVGSKWIEVPFLVIQHANLAVQERYLPMMESDAQKHFIHKSNVAYLQDRIRMKKKLPQLYGTQFLWNEVREKLELYPVQDMQNVDKLRASVGLKPLAEYMKENNVKN